MRRSDKKSKYTGFTLVELLVVIATIAVLMAVLMPVLGRAKDLAKGISCRSNLRNLATAWSMYLDDNEGRFYQGVNANHKYGGWKGTRGWYPRPLNEYVGLKDPNTVTEKSAKVFRCPADRGGVPGPDWAELAYRVNGTSYQTNIFLIGPTECGANCSRTAELDREISDRLSSVNRDAGLVSPSRLLLMGDYGWVGQWVPTPHLYQELKEMAEWHNRPDHHNVAFLDGHVDFLNVQKGYYATNEYCVLPFKDLLDLAQRVQGPLE